MFSCLLQALTDEIEVQLWRGDAAFRFFLKRMQHVNRIAQFDGVRTAKGAVSTFVVRSHFNHVAKVVMHPEKPPGSLRAKLNGLATRPQSGLPPTVGIAHSPTMLNRHDKMAAAIENQHEHIT